MLSKFLKPVSGEAIHEVGIMTKEETLGDLWSKAEQLGRIDVDHPFGSNDYRVEIYFHTDDDCRIYAKHTARTIFDAIDGAIKKAVKMGAIPKLRA